jgi:hypothetical protein
MKKLNVDLDLLLESFTLEKEGVCREYLDTLSGEVINIPVEVASAVENCSEGDELESWQRTLLEDAQAIYSDKDGRYLNIPTIKSDFSYKLIGDFISEVIKDKQSKEKFEKTLSHENAMTLFKNELYDNPTLLDLWHDYVEQKLKDYIVEWLQSFDIMVV